jgi:elongation factor Ts
MTTITPTMIKDLRDRTGVGMSKCKEALEEAKGDMELAITNLRKSGVASAVKKEGRETKEGIIGISENKDLLALIEISAETDFVVRNDRFKQFVEEMAEQVAQSNPPSLDAFLQQTYVKDPSLTVDQYRATIVQAIGENIQIKRIFTIKKSSEHSVGAYSHAAGKIVTVVEISGGGQEEALARDIAMHVAAASPQYLSQDKVPQEIIEHEREIAKSQILNKPAAIADKIIEGKIATFYNENCLICQKYVKDDSQTIAEVVNQKSKEKNQKFAITSFVRWSVGE